MQIIIEPTKDECNAMIRYKTANLLGEEDVKEKLKPTIEAFCKKHNVRFNSLALFKKGGISFTYIKAETIE